MAGGETKPRGDGIALPTWWLRRVNEIYSQRGDGLAEVGAQLGRVQGRASAWTHGSVSRFLTGKNTTKQMAEAFSELYGLPRPFFEARTLDEALALQGVAKKYDSSSQANPERERRITATDQLLDEEHDLARRQIGDLPSRNEGRSRGRRSRRAS